MDRSTRILHTLRDHPWSETRFVARLTEAPLRSVQRRLAQLVDEGLAQRKRVSFVRGYLYAPTKDGIVELAGDGRRAKSYARAFGLDAYHLAGTLLRAHSLTWMRDFLACLAADGRLQWAVSPHDVHVGRRVLHLDGHGCALWMGRYLRFAVLADSGGLAIEGYAPTFKRFARWARRDEFAGDRPVLILLTTYDRRAQQLSVLWGRAAPARSSSPEMFVGVLEEIEERPSSWYRGGESGRGALWRGCRGSSTMIPRPRPSLVSRTGSRATLVQDVSAWGRGSVRGRRLRTFLALSGKEWRVLHQVARWPLLRSTGLALLGGYSGDSAGAVSQMLQKLEGQGLVRVVRADDAERRLLELQRAQIRGRLARVKAPTSRAELLERLLKVEDALFTADRKEQEASSERYALSHRGLGLLAAANGMTPLAYGEARLWPVGYAEVGEKRVVDFCIDRLLLTWEHTSLTNEFFLGLRRLAERQWTMERNHRLLIWDSVECRRWFWDEEGRQLLLPDSGGVYQIGDEVYEFWLEIDRGHSVAGKHGEALKRKYERYYLYRFRPDAIYGRSMPRILVVTPQIGRARQVRRVVLDLARERGEAPLPIYLTTLDDIWLPAERLPDGTQRPVREGADGADGPGRPARKRMWPGLRMWRRVDVFDRLRWCFEGMGRMPAGTQRGLDTHRLRRETRAHSRRSEAQRRRRARMGASAKG